MLQTSQQNKYMRREESMEFLELVGQVGFPIAGAIAAGVFVFVTLRFILNGVTDSVNTLKNIIGALDNRVQTMNNDLVKIDTLLSYVLHVRPNIDRIAANEGKDDARKD
jgi:archaellum biogenesis ATPase FlaH